MSDKPKKAPIGRTVRRIVLAALALGVIASVIVFVATRKPPPVKAAPIQARLSSPPARSRWTWARDPNAP